MDTELKELKEEITKEIISVVDDKMSPLEKFNTYFTAADALMNLEHVKKAFEAAKSIEDPSERSECLMDLLELVSLMQSARDVDDTHNNDNQSE